MDINIKKEFWDFVKRTETCWLWQGHLNAKGYGQISRHLSRKRYMAHRVSYQIHKGIIPNGMLVCHSCDVRNCVNPSHLWIGTNNENMLDMKNKKRGRNAIPRITDNKRLKILELKNLDMKIVEIANITGAHYSSVSKILKGTR